MTKLELSVIHRLPVHYRWRSGFTGVKVEPIASGVNDDELIGLTLLSHDSSTAWAVMHELAQSLQEIQVSCSVVECDGQPCLFLRAEDECAGLCRFKNIGVAIAEPAGEPYPRYA